MNREKEGGPNIVDFFLLFMFISVAHYDYVIPVLLSRTSLCLICVCDYEGHKNKERVVCECERLCAKTNVRF